MSRFLQRSLELIKNDISNDIKSNTLKDVSEMITDSKQITDSIHEDAAKLVNNTKSTYKRIKSGQVFKDITDWFYGKSDEFDIDSDDDFEPGIDLTGDDKDEDSDEGKPTLSISTKESNKQISAMFKIGAKQAEANAAIASNAITVIESNTGKIITNIRELTTSVNNIGSKLDRLIQLNVARAEDKPEYKNESITGEDGGIMISKLFEAVKESNNITNNMLMVGLDMVKGFISPDETTPEKIVGAIHTAIDDKIKIGGKSISDWKSSINDVTGAATQSILENILSNEKIQNILGDPRGNGIKDKDFSSLRVNNYNESKATFDNMARQSIVSIIPAYLRSIDAALNNGKMQYINDYGELTYNKEDKGKNKFRNVTKSAFRGGTISSSVMDELYEHLSTKGDNGHGMEISESDLRIATEAIKAAYVMKLYSSYNTAMFGSDMYGDDNKTSIDLSIVEYAVDLLVDTNRIGGGDSEKERQYWKVICINVLQRITFSLTERQRFVKEVNKAYQEMNRNASSVAQSLKYGNQAGKITKEMLHDSFVDSYGNKKNGTPSNNGTNNNGDATLSNNNNNGGGNNNPPPLNPNNGDATKLSNGGNSGGNNNPINLPSNPGSSGDATKPKQDEEQKKNDSEKSDDGEKNSKKSSGKESEPSVIDKLFEPINSKVQEAISKVLPQEKRGQISKGVSQIEDAQSASDVANGIRNALVGSKKESGEEKGDVVKSVKQTLGDAKDIVQNLGFAGIEKGKAVIKDFTEKTSDTFKNSVAKAKEKETFKDTIRSVNKIKINDETDESKEGISREDQMQAQAVLQMAQVAVADGDPSADMSQIKTLISRIKNTDLQKKIRLAVEPMLNRMTSDSKDGTNETKKGGFFGVVAKIGTVIGGVFTAIANKMKSFLVSGWKIIKSAIGKFGKKFLSPLLNLFTSGAKDVVTGTKAVATSLFGQKEKVDENGNVIQEAQTGLLNPIGNIAKKTGKAAVGVGTKLGNAVGNFAKYIPDIASSSFKALGYLGGAAAEKIANSNVVRKVGNKVSNTAEKIGDGVSKTKTNIIDKMSKSELGKGFLSVYKKEEEKKAKEELSKPKTMADQQSLEIKDALTNENNESSLLAKLYKLIKTKFSKEEAEEKENDDAKVSEEETDETSSESENNGDAKQTDQTDDTSSSSSESSGDATQSSTQTTETSSSTSSGDATIDLGGSTGSDSDSEESSGGEITSASSESSSSGEGSSSTSSSGGSGKLSGMFKIGKLLGGMTKILGGIGKMILSIIAGMSGFKALMSLVEKTLTKSLKPLNKAFQSLYKAIKPIFDQLGKILKTVVESITEILESVIDAIQPAVEGLSPILNMIMKVLNPILEIITSMVKVLLVPITKVVTVILLPIIKQIGNSLELISGVLQFGFGLLMTGIGGIIAGLGALLHNENTKNTGLSLAESGVNLVSGGIKSIGSSISNTIDNIKDTWYNATHADNTTDKEDNNNDTSGKMYTEVKKYETNQTFDANYALNDGTYVGDIQASGDTQSSYGGYLNMGKHGCGPLALSDSITRRTGGSLSASSLASHMYGSGLYDTNRGTSVAGYMLASSAMGVPLTAGTVTRDSIRSASPNNPVTLVGSGNGFGTRSGNNHYVNVVGSSGGYALVSNPLTGKVSRQSMTDVINNSKLGLYGSGDDDDDGPFSTAVSEALSKLKNIGSRIVNLFLGSEDDLEDELESARTDEKYKDVEKTLSTLSEEEQKSYEDMAYELFKSENIQKSNETDEAYKQRWEKNKKSYMIRVSQDKVFEVLSGEYNDKQSVMTDYYDSIYNENSGLLSGLSNAISSALTQNSSSSSGSYNGETGVFASDDNVVMRVPYKPTVTETNMTIKTNGQDHYGQSPIHEFIMRMADEPEAWSEANYGNFWNQRYDQDETGEGHSGGSHKGIDIHTTNDDAKKVPVYATTDGDVIDKGIYSDGCSHVTWTDSAGHTHRVIHMRDIVVSKGQKLKSAETLLGYIGNVGCANEDGSGNYHVHYDIDNGSINPMTFFKWRPNSGTGSTGFVAESDYKDDLGVWTDLIVNGGMTEQGAAGVMGNFKAESNLRSDNVEDSSGYDDTEYSARVNDGTYSRQQFGSDNIGYGLAQWTYYDPGTNSGRKFNMYDYVMPTYGDIRSLRGQLDFLRYELGGYSSLMNTLKTTSNVYDATDQVMMDYERPRDKDLSVLNYRAGLAQEIYDAFTGKRKESLGISQEYIDNMKEAADNNVSNIFDLANSTLQTFGVNNTTTIKQVDETADKSLKSIYGSEVYQHANDMFRNAAAWQLKNDNMSVDEFLEKNDSKKLHLDTNSFKNLYDKFYNVTGESKYYPNEKAKLTYDNFMALLGDIYTSHNLPVNGPGVWDDVNADTFPDFYASGDNYSGYDPIYDTDTLNNMFNNVKSAQGSDIPIIQYHVISNKNNDDISKLDMLNAILENDFAVHDSRLEQLVQKVIDKMDEKKTTTSTTSISSGSQNTEEMFSNEIPEQVVKLYS